MLGVVGLFYGAYFFIAVFACRKFCFALVTYSRCGPKQHQSVDVTAASNMLQNLSSTNGHDTT